VISSKSPVHITACLISKPTCWLGGTARDLQLDDQTMGTKIAHPQNADPYGFVRTCEDLLHFISLFSDLDNALNEQATSHRQLMH
jgi:hypothetical protein